jgi:hypothetical protein
MALPGNAHAFFKGFNDVVATYAVFFCELVDAKHEGAYLEEMGRAGSMRQPIAYSPKR